MNHQTFNGASDISARIGALELGAIGSFDDSALEAAHSVGGGQTMPGSFGCRPFADDSELESTVQAGPTTQVRNGPFCMAIDDGALETFVQAGPGPTMPPMCYRIDDGALEASVQAGPQTMPPMCRFIDDGALEATIHTGPTPTFPPMCMRIDDEGLEGSATVRAHVGPTTNPPMCFRIDDGALESSIQAGPQPTMPPMCRFIDDGALESAVAHADLGPTIRVVQGRCV